GSNKECGAGPITFTDFSGGLTAHFQEGRLVGWNWHLAQEGDAPASGVVKLAGEVQVGSPRSVAEAAPGYAPVEGSTLGEEFALGQRIGGFIAGDSVEMLYAGTQCFFR
ncbi:MAG: aspartate-semialdehyde dehydrogenase, partial [Erythrobacter sp.]|nr:aspartate-semialdehyde dehydrogenase [Erythrobacter sp.]